MMSKLLPLLFFLIALNGAAQIVNIPDANFKTALLDHTDPVIDTNSDGEIEVAEAKVVTQLFIANREITNLTGVEAFVALQNLDCHNNLIEDLILSSNPALLEIDARFNSLGTVNLSQNSSLTHLNLNENLLTVLNISENTQLQILRCNSNFLTSLDLSNQLNLEQFSASFNEITNITLGSKPQLTIASFRTNLISQLNISQCPLLGALSVQFNQLVALDTSNNPLLRILRCHGNELNDLNFSTNTNLQSLYCYLNPLQSLNLKNGANQSLLVVEANLNPQLSCIEVDNQLDANAGLGVYGDWLVDEDVAYAEDCELSLELFGHYKVLLWPNPIDKKLNIKSKFPLTQVNVYNSLGQRVFYYSPSSLESEIDVTNWAKGPYLLQLSGPRGDNTYRIIKF